MPKKKRKKPLYQRGPYRLFAREGRNHEIIWYDEERKRERSASAGTTNTQQGREALDRLYLANEGARYCPTCGQELQGEHAPAVGDVIADYLLLHEDKAGFRRSAKPRLRHVVDYLAETRPDTTVIEIDERWIEAFRKWLLAKPVLSPKGKVLRERSIGHVEGCVLQLAAVINSLPNHKARFKAQPLKEVSATPAYRADIETLAAMFRFALEGPEERKTLLTYLRAAVATWARPEAILEIDSRKNSWQPTAGVLDLNQKGRRQTKKYRPAIPIAWQYRPHLDGLDGLLLPVVTLRHAWDPMRKKLGLPGEGQAGPKLIRRSVATLARRVIGEADWAQGEMMLGHRKASTSDIYALPDPANLGKALAATEQIIDQIEALAPGSYRNLTAEKAQLSVVKGGKSV